MKKALLKKIPVVEAGIKDKQYMELCRQNYLDEGTKGYGST